MTTEQQKLEAAKSVVASSILHGSNTKAKVEYIKAVLPNHYEVKESKQKGNVHCKSSNGINDDEQWSYFMQGLKQRFADFSEVNHNTCHNHVDFTVYFRSK
jgi:hypothetical protein